MHCEAYQDLVAAHVDGRLSPDERHAVQEHLNSCQQCRQLFAQQQDFIRAFRSHSLIVAVPDELEQRLRAALADDKTISVPTGLSAWQRLKGRFTLPLLPRFALGLAAAGIVGVLLLPRLFPALLPEVSQWFGSEPDIVASAVVSYRAMTEGAPSLTYPAQEPAQLEASFNRSGHLDFVTHVLDLRYAGFQLRGGTIQHVATRPIALTVYDDGADHILCLRQQGQMPVLPAGGEWIDSHYLYTDGVYTIFLTQFPDHFCTLVSGLSRKAFLQRVVRPLE